MRHRGAVEARDGSARSAEARTEVGKLANAALASPRCGSVRGADGSSGGDGITSATRSAASSEPVAEGIADADGNGSTIVTARGTTAVAITITITNRYGVIEDPVHVRDGHHHGDGTGDGRIDVATGNGAEHRAGGAEVEDEAVAAIDRTRSVEVVACRREAGSRRDGDATRLPVVRLTRQRP